MNVAYIFLATIFYIATPDLKENLYSWQITFNSFEKCEQFFDAYGASLMNGVIDHGTNKYGQQVGLEYLSCAKVTIDPQSLIDGDTHPKILEQRVMYKGS